MCALTSGSLLEVEPRSVEARSIKRSCERLDEPFEFSVADIEFIGAEQHHNLAGTSGDNRGKAGHRNDNFTGHVITVEQLEGNSQRAAPVAPIRALRKHAMGDITERTVRRADAGAEPVPDFATDCPVGVVDADEGHNRAKSHGRATPHRRGCR